MKKNIHDGFALHNNLIWSLCRWQHNFFLFQQVQENFAEKGLL